MSVRPLINAFLAPFLAPLALAAGSVQAQEAAAPAKLLLICTGSDAVLFAMAPNTLNGRRYGAGMAFGQGRGVAQMEIKVEGETVRALPPKTSVPLLARGDDEAGWYTLSEVKIEPTLIEGRIRWNAIDRERLRIDRRTGLVTFGNFRGVCQPVVETQSGVRF
jgi:hypothetical protein